MSTDKLGFGDWAANRERATIDNFIAEINTPKFDKMDDASQTARIKVMMGGLSIEGGNEVATAFGEYRASVQRELPYAELFRKDETNPDTEHGEDGVQEPEQ